LHDDGNALENTFELLPFFAIAEHGRRKSVSAREYESVSITESL
jgi:hypothetical protein